MTGFFTRYVATIADSVGYCLPLLKEGGKWIAYKSGEETIKTEIDKSTTRLSTLGGTVEAIITNSKFDRSYVVMRRIKTPTVGKIKVFVCIVPPKRSVKRKDFALWDTEARFWKIQYVK